MIRILLADDEHLIRGAMAALLSLEDDLEVVAQAATGAEAGAIGRNAIHVHQLDFRDPLAQHRHACLDEPLAFLGRGVLRVLAQVAKLAGALNFLRQLLRELAIERRNFHFKPLDQPIFHGSKLRLT